MNAKAMAKKKAAIQGLPSGNFENASSQGEFPIEKLQTQTWGKREACWQHDFCKLNFKIFEFMKLEYWKDVHWE